MVRLLVTSNSPFVSVMVAPDNVFENVMTSPEMEFLIMVRTVPAPPSSAALVTTNVVAEAAQHPVAIVFGREDRGLTNEELHQCHYHVHIPADEEYPVLNLAMAVQVICYEIRMMQLTSEGKLPTELSWQQEWDLPLATADDMEKLFQHFEQAMIETGFLAESTANTHAAAAHVQSHSS